MWPFTVGGVSGGIEGERAVEMVPSRTLKPMSSQLMVLTGGGGNAMVEVGGGGVIGLR